MQTSLTGKLLPDRASPDAIPVSLDNQHETCLLAGQKAGCLAGKMADRSAGWSAVKVCQWPPMAINGRQWPPMAANGRANGRQLPPMMAANGRPWPPMAVNGVNGRANGRQWLSMTANGCVNGRQWPSIAVKCRQWPRMAASIAVNGR